MDMRDVQNAMREGYTGTTATGEHDYCSVNGCFERACLKVVPKSPRHDTFYMCMAHSEEAIPGWRRNGLPTTSEHPHRCSCPTTPCSAARGGLVKCPINRDRKPLQGNSIPLRKPLHSFVVLCEKRMRLHDHDYGEEGWRKSDSRWLMHLLLHDALALDQMVLEGNGTPEEIAKKAADIANFSMMVADNALRGKIIPEGLK